MSSTNCISSPTKLSILKYLWKLAIGFETFQIKLGKLNILSMYVEGGGEKISILWLDLHHFNIPNL